jgi:protein-S-isoprenylcysteine O-methyltransferase Ste14
MTRWISPPVAFAIAAVAIWWLARSVEWGHFSFPYQAVLSLCLIVLAIAVIAAALWSFAKARTTPNPMHPDSATALVASGPYRLSRNPMYVGDAIALLGIALWLGSVPGLIAVAAFVAFIDRFQIPQEERALAAIFGERYAEYRRQVRRWL